jgi:peptidoglycan hydrolase-like protein with peptidoglycan-binding domain
VLKELDPNKTKEWVLNDAVARHFAEAASEYEDVELLRVDDPAGVAPVNLYKRSMKANDWGANFFLSIHHNGFEAKVWKGGGLVAFSYPGSTKGAQYRDAIYDACIKAGGLVGDRATPKATANFQVLRQTDAPAVLVEYGFMDSAVDGPVIITDAYAKAMGYATMEGIAKIAGLKKKKASTIKPTTTSTPTQEYTLKEFIKDIQKACGAAVDGIAGPETLSKTVTISAKKNNKHAAVKYVQKRLAALGYTEVGIADGVAGPKFTSAVAHFQLDNKCITDGEITAGKATWKKLLGMR